MYHDYDCVDGSHCWSYCMLFSLQGEASGFLCFHWEQEDITDGLQPYLIRSFGTQWYHHIWWRWVSGGCLNYLLTRSCTLSLSLSLSLCSCVSTIWRSGAQWNGCLSWQTYLWDLHSSQTSLLHWYRTGGYQQVRLYPRIDLVDFLHVVHCRIRYPPFNASKLSRMKWLMTPSSRRGRFGSLFTIVLVIAAAALLYKVRACEGGDNTVNWKTFVYIFK